MIIRKITESRLLAVSAKPSDKPLYLRTSVAREKAYLYSTVIDKTPEGMWVRPSTVGLPGDAVSREQGYRDVCELFCAACELDAEWEQVFTCADSELPLPRFVMAL